MVGLCSYHKANLRHQIYFGSEALLFAVIIKLIKALNSVYMRRITIFTLKSLNIFDYIFSYFKISF